MGAGCGLRGPLGPRRSCGASPLGGGRRVRTQRSSWASALLWRVSLGGGAGFVFFFLDLMETKMRSAWEGRGGGQTIPLRSWVQRVYLSPRARCPPPHTRRGTAASQPRARRKATQRRRSCRRSCWEGRRRRCGSRPSSAWLPTGGVRGEGWSEWGRGKVQMLLTSHVSE